MAENAGLHSGAELGADLGRDAATNDASAAAKNVGDVGTEIVGISIRADTHGLFLILSGQGGGDGEDIINRAGEVNGGLRFIFGWAIQFAMAKNGRPPKYKHKILAMKVKTSLYLPGASPESIKAIACRAGLAAGRLYTTRRESAGVCVWRDK